ncbi:MAG: hypothetical protein HWN65_08395 [Candidatus Helarchaeota archaeon]|nr:hypothetical protein [Candidatus Helarchaeota archaeon]
MDRKLKVALARSRKHNKMTRHASIRYRICVHCIHGREELNYIHCSKHVPLDKRPHSSNKITCERFAKKDVTSYYNPINRKYICIKLPKGSRIPTY